MSNWFYPVKNRERRRLLVHRPRDKSACSARTKERGTKIVHGKASDITHFIFQCLNNFK